MTRRLACAAALGLCGASALAQTAPAASVYEDRVLDAGPQADLAEADPAATSGWPRGWSAELQSTRQSGQAEARNEALLFSGYVDTPDYGALSANLNLNRYRNTYSDTAIAGNFGANYTLAPYRYETGNTWRIDQRAMPFDGGWFGNSSAGNINMAVAPMGRGIGRVTLPALSIEGMAATLERPGRTSFNASAGRLGYFSGLDSQGFATGKGTAAGFGAQTQLAGADQPDAPGRVDAAAQFIESRDVNPNGVAGFRQDTRALWAAASWQGVAPWADTLGAGQGGIGERVGGMRVQGNVVGSTSQPSSGYSLAGRDSASGAWVDANWRSAWLQQSASAYYFEPQLRWGADGLPANIKGMTWRGDMQTRQWQLGLNTEWSDSVTGPQNRSLYVNVFGRYRLDSRDAVSGNVAVRSGAYAAQSAQLTWEHQSAWGYTQWRTDVALGKDLRVVRTGVDHSWKVGESQTLSTTLAFEHSYQGGDTARSVQWGVLGTAPLPGTSGARLDLTVRGSQGVGDTANRFLNANVRLVWPLAPGWSFVAQYAASRGQEQLNPAVLSALTVATLQPTLVQPSGRSMLLALRYESRAGSSSAPIGGAPGAGSGRVEGHVFFDQDHNGKREASEGGVPNVTVMLNGRYVARTDAQGYYSFPAVAAGAYEVELVPDNLPLPWMPAVREGTKVQVYVRSAATADFAVQRER
ncbi:SdrD B-like domain-containing protein [Variovorax sp. dw_954]|uniref:SdrD B-like domain-containing protein n=1 Tax=Variovorax sp. dw_954 TaxID=2720078 RepID=UPI001BD5AD3B|nr:SdrD B-like domain-containing protein [Variovorax sp. dw_954]